jgi:protein arginine kinase
MEDKNSASAILSQKHPWEENDNSIWLASTISFFRNVEKFKFPGKMSAERRKQLIALVSKEILASPSLKNPFLCRSEELTPTEKEFLVEHFLTMQGFQQAHSGEAFILDVTGEFLASLNMRDHIHLQLLDTRGELENSWNRLVKIETSLGKALNYSFSPRFGFLTADPKECGTALQIFLFLQLPALLHTEKLESTLSKYGDDAISITGLQGDPHELIGDILAVHNNYTLGLTEENIISSLRTFATKMIVEERSERSRLHHEDNTAVKDKISRAYGILLHSFQIETIEALNALSLIKLGVELGWVTGLTMRELNALTFSCRRGHLMKEFDSSIAKEEIGHKRSEFIHKQLKNLVLKT